MPADFPWKAPAPPGQSTECLKHRAHDGVPGLGTDGEPLLPQSRIAYRLDARTGMIDLLLRDQGAIPKAAFINP